MHRLCIKRSVGAAQKGDNGEIESLTANSVPLPGYTVGVVAQRLGVPTATLRSWSQRYGLGPHGHMRGRHRLYSESDIGQLQQMLLMVQAGASPASAAACVKSRLASTVNEGSASASEEAEQLVSLAEQLDTSAMSIVLERSLQRRGVIDTWNGLCRPAYAALVDRQITGACIDAEHALSWVLAGSFRSVVQARQGLRDEGIVLACTPGERHLLPMDVLAAALAEAGIAVRMLGSDVPLTALADALARIRPQTLVLWSQIPETADPDAVGIGLSRAGRVFVGGQGWQSQPEGARLLTDLEAARDTLAGLPIGGSDVR